MKQKAIKVQKTQPEFFSKYVAKNRSEQIHEVMNTEEDVCIKSFYKSPY